MNKYPANAGWRGRLQYVWPPCCGQLIQLLFSLFEILTRRSLVPCLPVLTVFCGKKYLVPEFVITGAHFLEKGSVKMNATTSTKMTFNKMTYCKITFSNSGLNCDIQLKWQSA
jgi:hypothetical protein